MNKDQLNMAHYTREDWMSVAIERGEQLAALKADKAEAAEAWAVLEPSVEDGRLIGLWGIRSHKSWPILSRYFGGE